MRLRWKLLIVSVAVLLVVAVGWVIIVGPSQQPQVVTATITPPTNLHFVPPNLCMGTYDNGVSVSWPAVNGTC